MFTVDGFFYDAWFSHGLSLKDTSTSYTEVCYLDTNIKTGDNTPLRISIYDKREDFAFRIVNFPHISFPQSSKTISYCHSSHMRSIVTQSL